MLSSNLLAYFANACNNIKIFNNIKNNGGKIYTGK